MFIFIGFVIGLAVILFLARNKLTQLWKSKRYTILLQRKEAGTIGDIGALISAKIIEDLGQAPVVGEDNITIRTWWLGSEIQLVEMKYDGDFSQMADRHRTVFPKETVIAIYPSSTVQQGKIEFDRDDQVIKGIKVGTSVGAGQEGWMEDHIDLDEAETEKSVAAVRVLIRGMVRRWTTR